MESYSSSYHHEEEKPDTLSEALTSQDEEIYQPDLCNRPYIAIAIPFPNGCIALVDKADHDLSDIPWHMSSTKGYAQHKITDESGKRRYVFLHRIIGERMLNRPLTHNDFIKHRNGDILDNRRENIVPLTRSEAVQQAKKSASSTSVYKGVTFNKEKQKWQSRIKFHGKTRLLGYYAAPEEAAEAYNKAAIELFGEHAKLNSIPDTNNIADNTSNRRDQEGEDNQ